MPKLNNINRLPKMCRDRKRAFSWHKGKRVYHGTWGTEEADRNYRRFLDRLRGSPDDPLQEVVSSSKTGEMLVSELCNEFVKYHAPRMHKTHVTHFDYAIPFLVNLYGAMSADEVSPKKMRTVRDQLVKSGRFCRGMVNSYTTKLIRIFVWGAEEEYVSAAVAGALKMIKPLPKGEPGTFDNPKRRNVSDEIIRRTLAFLSKTIAAMVMLQRLLGCRPSEIFNMRVGDIVRDADPELWFYIPGQHKTQRLYEDVDEEKIIPLGKPEQAILAPFLEGKRPEAAVFSPKAESKSGRAGEFYNRSSYRNAVQRGVKRANRKLAEGEKPIPMWSPYQLRHQAATSLSKQKDGDKLAAALLDHTSVSTTARYIHERLEKRKELALNRVNPFAESDEATE